ncbi:MAG: trypsin-like serine protease [Myxococcota bacterium]
MNLRYAPLALLLACAVEAQPVESISQAIVGGEPVGVCGHPTTVLVGNGCTGTLIHPRVVVTAAHCGSPRTVGFGERQGRTVTRAVECRAVPGRGTAADVQFCVLDEPMEDLPLTPVLYGCELDELDVGDEVVITGFGQTAFNTNTFGTQRWSFAPIRQLFEDVSLIGTPEASACPGDSGGPVFLRMADDTWRVFGTVSGGTTGIPCNGDGAYPRIDRYVPWFEETFGIDITPCHDADGSWNPGPDCGGFFAGDHTGGQVWADECAGAPVGGASAICGAPFAPDEPDAGPSDVVDMGVSDMGASDMGAADTGPPDVGVIVIPDDAGAAMDAFMPDDGNVGADAGVVDAGHGESPVGGCSAGSSSSAALLPVAAMFLFYRRRR